MNHLILRMALTISAIACVMAFPVQSPAAPHRIKMKPHGLNTAVRSGVIVGGSAGAAVSILRMQRLKAAGGAERLVILYGDQKGQPVKAEPGYFHINVDPKAKRVSLDLAQVHRSAIDAKALRHMFSRSALIAADAMTTDPIDLSTNLSFKMKRPVEVKAFTQTIKGTQQLVIEMRPTRRVSRAKDARKG